ncbi:MAG: hypothetical protein JHC94_02020 [Acidimicrobiia bacterium]|nr:hypothetical protein [Acidimicrobiia bacterium]MBJ7513085.1 hypothetical protein [Acidimicrobiia bacterium]
MSSQLRLLPGGQRSRHLDAKTRQIGRKGVAEARATLARIQQAPSTKQRLPHTG